MQMIRRIAVERLRGACRLLTREIKKRLAIPNALIQLGKTGRKFTVRGSKGKYPSKPGEYPRKVTGNLQKSVTYEVDKEQLQGRVGTELDYGSYLELGTKNMKPRPWLMRTFDAIYNQLIKILREGE